MTRHEYTAKIVRGILTAANVDLLRGSKREIEELIAVGLSKADAQWEAFAREQAEQAAPRMEEKIERVRETFFKGNPARLVQGFTGNPAPYCDCWLCDNTGPQGQCIKCGRMPSPDRHATKEKLSGDSAGENPT